MSQPENGMDADQGGIPQIPQEPEIPEDPYDPLAKNPLCPPSPEGSIIPRLWADRRHAFILDISQETANRMTSIHLTRLVNNATGIDFPIEWDFTFDNAKQRIGEVEYQGNLTTRIIKLVELARGKKDMAFNANIGNWVTICKVTPGRYAADFDNQLRWKSGSFGDGGSCFMTSNSLNDANSPRAKMRRAGYWAIRVFHPRQIEEWDWEKNLASPTDGIARAWIAPDQPEVGMALVYNAYGRQMSNVAGIAAARLNLATGPVRGGVWFGPGYMYTNNDGWLLGTPEQVVAWTGKNIKIQFDPPPPKPKPPKPKKVKKKDG